MQLGEAIVYVHKLSGIPLWFGVVAFQAPGWVLVRVQNQALIRIPTVEAKRLAKVARSFEVPI